MNSEEGEIYHVQTCDGGAISYELQQDLEDYICGRNSLSGILHESTDDDDDDSASYVRHFTFCLCAVPYKIS